MLLTLVATLVESIEMAKTEIFFDYFRPTEFVQRTPPFVLSEWALGSGLNLSVFGLFFIFRVFGLLGVWPRGFPLFG